MACQMDPNVYGFMCRCPMEDAAKLKQLADEMRRRKRRGIPRSFRREGCEATAKPPARARAGMTLSGYLAQMIAERVADVELEEYLNAWMDDQYQRNLKKRKYQDEKTASGYYRVKRPKKRGRPPKAKKRGRPPKKIRKTRSDKGIPRGPKRVVTPVINGEVIKAT